MSDPLRCQGLYPVSFLCPWNSPGKKTGMGCHFLLQGIFLTQGLNPGLEPRSPALQAESLPSELSGKPNLLWGIVIREPQFLFRYSCS